ncbi:C1 family peptidase [Pelagicoccus sp. SDUM812003]|uniref:C1 family peptidase n=1 Tax=Pelagicoccus sp. SDUM812003 TaxID=3041267 RepID=UPI00280F71AC|nr:C1 family peptidase [Pelagicoccus sp. SDUM812003]MDQ8203048.1 C1 family peptidase [Pelagicoccus sp. SDUM812003]
MKALLLLVSCFLSVALRAADYFEQLQVGAETYHQVYVLSANASALSVRHAGGLSQIPLSRLSPEVQSRYGYDAQADALRRAELERSRDQQQRIAQDRFASQKREAERRAQAYRSAQIPLGLDSAFAAFGQPPQLDQLLDLRPSFRSHQIAVRSQRGPSCSVHAIVAALEYQYAEKQGMRVDISETHLIRATSQMLRRRPKNPIKEDIVALEDEGYTLEQVFQAIRAYGLRIEKADASQSDAAFAERFETVNFRPYRVPGAGSMESVQNMVHVLNAKMPVVVGIGWPEHWRIQHTNLLSQQPPAPGVGHAVAIVGYKNPTGKLEDARFIFRNSWGIEWGAGGYGFMTGEYLKNNLLSAYVVELR